jgi:hypothetical protein
MRHANTDLFSKSSVMAPHPFQTHFIAEIAVILKSGGACLYAQPGVFNRWAGGIRPRRGPSTSVRL